VIGPSWLTTGTVITGIPMGLVENVVPGRMIEPWMR
jgi:hypothetical protein